MEAAARWCTTAEAAAQLQVTRPTVIAWLRNRTLRGHIDDGARRRVWRVEVKSVEECLAARGGPGARRGRPSGSISEIAAELAGMRRRIDALEAAVGGSLGGTLSLRVLSSLVELLHVEGAESVTRAQRVKDATEYLAGLLNAKSPSGLGLEGKPATEGASFRSSTTEPPRNLKA